MPRQDEFDLGAEFAKVPRKYRAGPYFAVHHAGDRHATVYHKSDPENAIDTIPTMVKGGPQASLNQWHANVRKNVR